MRTYEEQLRALITKDRQLQALLVAVESLDLEDAWICAGVIRNKVWDSLHQITTPLNDIDVIYFDDQLRSWEKEKEVEAQLNRQIPQLPWSVKNQARMHVLSGFPPFTSSYDGVAHFPETPTALAMRNKNGKLEIMAPYGLEDLFNLQVRPTPYYQKESDKYGIYLERIKKKKWEEQWVKLVIRMT